MEPIPGMTSRAVCLPAAAGVQQPPKVQQPEKDQARPLKPAMDEYVPEEKREPSGRYWLGRDGDGRPKIYFDDAERAADAPEKPGDAPGSKKPDEDAPDAEKPGQNRGAKGLEKRGKKEALCVGNTDKVDREIETLKKKRQELERRLNTETDETRVKDLEKQLAQVKRELSEKDNDTYRKRHSTFS